MPSSADLSTTYPTFEVVSADSNAKSADSNGEQLADSSPAFVVVGQQPILNMFDIHLLIQSVN